MPHRPACRWSAACFSMRLPPAYFFLEGHCLPVEVEPQQQRLAPVPAEGHRRHLVGLDVLADVALEQVVRHHGLASAVLHGLVQIIAVVAVEVAGRACRLDHCREGHGTRLLLGIAEGEDFLLLHSFRGVFPPRPFRRGGWTNIRKNHYLRANRPAVEPPRPAAARAACRAARSAPCPHPARRRAPVFRSRSNRALVVVEDGKTGDPLIGATVRIASRGDTLQGTTAKRDYYREVVAAYACDRIFRDSVDLEVTYVGYRNFHKRYAPDEFRYTVPVRMEVDPQAIAQVVVVGKRVAMVFRGDTTVYDAGAFKTLADDRFGELVRQLPGVEIRNEKIYANGKEVKRVLIDGRDLFGEATQHVLTDLEASDVKHVRIYEETSPEARRTNDIAAEKEKVMNIETKSKRAVLRGGSLEATLGASLEEELLRAARDPPHRVGLPLPQQRTGQPASRPAQLEGRRAEGECGIHAAGHPAAAHPRLPGAYAPPRRLDLGDERRRLHPRAEQLARQFAERLLSHRRVHAPQRREPQHVAFRVARGGHPQHDRHPPQAELLLRQRQRPLQRLRLPQREPDPAPHRRGADPDRHAHGQRPPQHRRRTQCRIRFPPLAPLVDESLGRCELLFGRQRRPADRHAGLDPRAAPSAAQRRRGDPLQHQRLGSLPLPAGRTRADPPLLPLRPRAQPLAAARLRLPERPAGGRRYGEQLRLHDRHPPPHGTLGRRLLRRPLPPVRIGRVLGQRDRAQRALSRATPLPAALPAVQPDARPLGRFAAAQLLAPHRLLLADHPRRGAAPDARRHQPPSRCARATTACGSRTTCRDRPPCRSTTPRRPSTAR